MKSILIILSLLFSYYSLANMPVEVMPNYDKSLYLDVETNGKVIVAVGERGHVALSSDYGMNWKQLENIPTRTTFTSVVIQNKNIWIVGHDTTIIHSKDSGENWEIQFQDAEREMPLLDVLFINESEGFAIGAYGTYLTTVDGGTNWNDGLLSEEDDYHLNSIVQVDDFRFFVVAEGGFAYRSFDAGKSWEGVSLPYNGSMFGAEALFNEIILYGLRGNIFVTEDFGDTFFEVKSSSTDSLFGSNVKSDNSVLIVGAKGSVFHYKNKNLVSVDMAESDVDYTDLVSTRNNKIVFVGESGIQAKKIR